MCEVLYVYSGVFVKVCLRLSFDELFRQPVHGRNEITLALRLSRRLLYFQLFLLYYVSLPSLDLVVLKKRSHAK